MAGKGSERRRALIGQLQTLGETASTETALFHQTAANRNGLGITDMKTLSILSQEGSMTAGQISQRLSLTTGAITSVIDRLERRDLVKREHPAEDRRKVIVTFNEKALAKTRPIFRSIGEAIVRLLGTYSTAELEFLVRYHKATIELTRQEMEKLAALEDLPDR